MRIHKTKMAMFSADLFDVFEEEQDGKRKTKIKRPNEQGESSVKKKPKLDFMEDDDQQIEVESGWVCINFPNEVSIGCCYMIGQTRLLVN